MTSAFPSPPHSPNNSFKPTLLRGSYGVVRSRYHAASAAAQRGLTQVLGVQSEKPEHALARGIELQQSVAPTVKAKPLNVSSFRLQLFSVSIVDKLWLRVIKSKSEFRRSLSDRSRRAASLSATSQSSA